jgi:peptidoglycan hydrolase CwlO-like protein
MTFFERMKKVMNQGFDSTRGVLGTAAEKAKELGEKGVLMYEIRKLEKDVERQLAALGNHVYDVFMEKGQATVSKSNADVKAIVMEIDDIKKRLAEKEQNLKGLG